jgi:hypothetical protein
LQVSTIPGQPVYQIGELITTEFVFKNAGTDTFQIEAFPPEIVLSLSAEDGVVIRRFPEGIESVYFDPGEVSSFTITWDQRDESGEQVPPGWYYFNTSPLITTTEGTVSYFVPVSRVLIR